MPRPTKHSPERGSARTRLLDASRDAIRARGFAATSVDELCQIAEVTKGSFFHHFKSKEALGVAAAQHWAEMTSAFFAAAPYHVPEDPLDRVLAYVAFRKSIIAGDLPAFTCLVGTMVQEVYDVSPAIRDACGRSIFGHAATLQADIMRPCQRGISGGWTAESLARHTQAVIQGAFVLAKAGNDPALARECIDHLDRYIRLLFNCPSGSQRCHDETTHLPALADGSVSRSTGRPSSAPNAIATVAVRPAPSCRRFRPPRRFWNQTAARTSFSTARTAFASSRAPSSSRSSAWRPGPSRAGSSPPVAIRRFSSSSRTATGSASMAACGRRPRCRRSICGP